MAYSIPFAPNPGRESSLRRAYDAGKQVRQIVEGIEPADPTVWTDADFQRAVLYALRTIPKLEEKASQLDVIREVFGGAKR